MNKVEVINSHEEDLHKLKYFPPGTWTQGLCTLTTEYIPHLGLEPKASDTEY